MDITSIPGILFLFTGGPTPALNAVNLQSTAIEGALGLKTAGTVYSGAMNPFQSRLALGTKLGYLLTGRLGKKCVGDWENIAMGSPILCTTFVDDSRIATATADGRVEMRNLQTPEEKSKLLLEHASVFTLAHAGAAGLAALDTVGTLRLWEDPATETIPRLIYGPSPAPAIRGARIRLVYWPETQQLVYPTAGGGLALIDTTTETVMAVPDHENDWYALLLRGDQLVSVGHSDGAIHQWRPGETTPTPIGSGPTGLVDGALLIGHGEPWLAIDIDGRALVLDGQGNALKTLEGVERVRAIVAPGLGTWGTLDRTWREREVTRLRKEAVAASGRNELEVLEELLGELEALGYGYAADELRAWAAESQQDFLRAVQHRIYLVNNLPSVPRSAPALAGAASLFERIGQPDVALYVYRKVGELEATEETANKIAYLSKGLDSAPRVEQVVERERDIPVEANLVCAAVLEQPRAFFFVYRRLDAWPCPGIEITGQELLAKYTHIQEEQRDQHLPDAAIQSLYWWCDRNGTLLEGIGLAMPSHDPSLEFHLWLLVESSGTDSVVSRAILARPNLYGASRDVRQEPGGESKSCDAVFNLWIARTCKALNEALWRIRNSKTADSNRLLRVAAATE